MSSPADCGGSDGCSPGPGNTIPCATLPLLGTRLQGIVDAARRIPHELGLRRHRVSLVWQRQDERSRVWVEHHRIELMPVKVEGLEEVEQIVTEGGLAPDGEITLKEVSPAQVSMATLRGHLDGADWPDDSEREFFFEIVFSQRCPGDSPEARLRFALSSEIQETPPMGYVFKLKAQHRPRRPDGTDAGVDSPRTWKDVVYTT